MWSPVNLQVQTGSQQEGIAKDFYKGFLDKNPSAQVQTAMIDTEGRGNLSIVVRLVSPKTCTQDKCHTVILSYQKGPGWHSVFERRSKSLEIQVASPTRVTNYARLLRVNSNEVWEMNPPGVYVADPDVFGKPFYAAQPVSTVFSAYLKKNGFTPDTMHQGEIPADALGFKSNVIVLQDDSCDNPGGCRTLMFSTDDKSTKLILDASNVKYAIYITPEKSKSMHDIVLQVFQGYQIWRWNGVKYILSETTYPSTITPAP
jgi:hypothetical protein